MSDNEVLLDLQQQRLERAMGAELQNTAQIIKRSGVFDEVDSKYGIPEEERAEIEAQAGAAGDEGALGGGGSMPPSAASEPPGEASEPLSERKKFSKIRSVLGESQENNDLFNLEKAQKNIYEIENKLNDIIND
jgi:hypothetical protein